MMISRVAFVFALLFFLPASTSASRRLNQPPRGADDHRSQPSTTEEGNTKTSTDLYNSREAMLKKRRGADPLQIAGSSLPDCSHACGACSPCRLVMVSFVCASLEEAETCPMAYKCMCKNKSYPVP